MATEDSRELSEHFSYAELTASQTAARRGLSNAPTARALVNLRLLCGQILEPARAALGPLHVTSGYRSKEVNRLVGGSPTSAHCIGHAADVIPLRASKMEFARWVAANCRFDQIILEFGTDEEPAWVHVSADPRDRRQILRATPRGYFPAKL